MERVSPGQEYGGAGGLANIFCFGIYSAVLADKTAYND